MMEFLEFIRRDVGHFIGFVIVFGMFAALITEVVKEFRK